MKPSEIRRQLVERCATAHRHHAVWDEGRDVNVLVRSAVDLDDLPERFGVYLIAPGSSTTRVLVLDLDNHGDPGLDWDDVLEIAKPITKHLRALGHSPMVFRSGGGRGIHIWIIWDEDQEAQLVRALGRAVVEACGHEIGDGGLEKDQIEIFPKQNAVPEDGVGNCIDIPLTRKSVPLDAKTLATLAEPRAVVTSVPLTIGMGKADDEHNDLAEGLGREHLDSALEAISADDYGDWITVLRALKGAGAKKQLKLTDKKAREIAEAWSKESKKHTHREFDYKWTRGCRRDANGNGRSLGSLFWLAKEKGWKPPAPPCCIDSIRIQNTDPTLFLVRIVDHEHEEIVMTSRDLNTAANFANIVLDRIHRVVKRPTSNDINALLAAADHIAVDDEDTELGQFKKRLLRFLDETLQEEKSALTFAMKSWRNEKNDRTYFKSDDLLYWFNREKIRDYQNHGSLLHLVRALDGNAENVNLGQSADGKRSYGVKRFWYVPLNPRADIVEIDPPAIKQDDDEEIF